MPSRRQLPSRADGPSRSGSTPSPIHPSAGSGPWAAAVSHLKAVDPKWGAVIDRIGPCRLRPRRDRFGTLVRAIIGQQISSKAAAAIHRRLLDHQPSNRLDPAALLSMGEDRLRTCGLSGVKARYVLNLADAVAEGRIALSRIGRLSDAEIVSQLTSVKGIGMWTAEMFLIFALNRPDVLPLGDLGVRVGLRDHFALTETPSPRQCIALTEPWRPFRTVAMWYLWQHLDAPPVSESPSIRSPSP